MLIIWYVFLTNRIKTYWLCVLLLIIAANTAIAQTTLARQQNIIVAKDGSGKYTTVQQAIDVVKAYSTEHITINIKNGIYHEKIMVPDWVTNISFIGESKDGTIITYDDYAGKFVDTDTVKNKTKFGTFNSYTMYVHGNDVTIENITIANTSGRVGQAVALRADGDRLIIRNCNLLGNQDTLLAANDSSRQYYFNCFIEGTTDFIFGNATAVFQSCTIKSLTNSYITAASTMQHQPFGYVFINCKLIAAKECTLGYLGRPWRPFAKVVFIGCEIGTHIRPEGWHNWEKIENEATAYYAEYNNNGPGSLTTNRVGWSKQLTEKQALLYTVENIFKGWKPI